MIMGVGGGGGVEWYEFGRGRGGATISGWSELYRDLGKKAMTTSTLREERQK